MHEIIARRFSMADQRAFAELSGDYNPMHMDPLTARRTQAGACVVHGVHSMLWAMEHLLSVSSSLDLHFMDADFAQFLYADEDVTLNILRATDAETRAELRIGSATISRFILKFGNRCTGEKVLPVDRLDGIYFSKTALTPLPLEWADVSLAHGLVEYFSGSARPESMFPQLCKSIGTARMQAILSLTRLVGMVSPGLYSVFHRLKLRLVDDPIEVGALHFAAAASDNRFALVTIDVRADGINGTVKASRRQPPTIQPHCSALSHLVSPFEFRGHSAVVIGGSRGLGELSAKLLALAGAHVTVTYAQGQVEAESVVKDILSEGGTATSMKINLLQPLAPQIQGLTARPSSIYFFATPQIFSRTTTAFSQALFNQFTRVYVEAFYEICTSFATTKERPLQVFYPSSIAVSEPVRGITEYSMAKAAGEVLAIHLTRFFGGIEVDTVRLPRLATDQTASMLGPDMEPAIDVMLPILRRVEERVRLHLTNGRQTSASPVSR